MPAGLQVWDNNGLLVFDTTDSPLRLLGVYDVPTTVANGSISHPELLLIGQGKARFWKIFQTMGGSAVLEAVPALSVDGGTGIIAWWWPQAQRAPHRLLYGIY
jgi:hypothetical protein